MLIECTTRSFARVAGFFDALSKRDVNVAGWVSGEVQSFAFKGAVMGFSGSRAMVSARWGFRLGA
jgi:hypothetical protein